MTYKDTGRRPPKGATHDLKPIKSVRIVDGNDLQSTGGIKGLQSPQGLTAKSPKSKEAELVNWLRRFENPVAQPCRPVKSPAREPGIMDAYLDKKKEDLETRHKLKLREFD